VSVAVSSPEELTAAGGVETRAERDAVRALLRRAGLLPLVRSSRGRADVAVALVDGPVETSHPALAGADVVAVRTGSEPSAAATAHATFAASILVGHRDATVGLCPGCRLLSVPVVDAEMLSGRAEAGRVSARLGGAVAAAADAGADVVLLGVELGAGAPAVFRAFCEAVATAARLGVRTVVPAGHGGDVASDTLATPGVVPVAIGDSNGFPHPAATWGVELGRRGLLAPGVGVPGAVPGESVDRRSGSSLAAALVAGAFALLRSMFPQEPSDAVWEALLDPTGAVHRSLVPRQLDAERSANLLRLSSRRTP
jgi:subtilisin family serine protease